MSMSDHDDDVSSTVQSVLTTRQERVLAFVPLVSSCLSLLGSITIIRLIILRKKFSKFTYDRILFALSCTDVLMSMDVALFAFLTPRETSRRIYSIGNSTTCKAIASLFTLGGTGSFLYSGMLSFYFLLKIRYQVTDSKMKNVYERYFHVIAIGLPLTTTIVGISLDVFDESRFGPGCWVVDRPMFGWISTALPYFIILPAVIINNVLIFCSVRATLDKRRDSIANRQAADNRLKTVAVQSFMYVSSFLLAFTWSGAARVLESQDFHEDSEGDMYLLLVLQAIFSPMQGIFNMIIYVRPRYMDQRQRRGFLESRWKTIQRELLLWGHDGKDIGRRHDHQVRGRTPDNNRNNYNNNANASVSMDLSLMIRNSDDAGAGGSADNSVDNSDGVVVVSNDKQGQAQSFHNATESNSLDF